MKINLFKSKIFNLPWIHIGDFKPKFYMHDNGELKEIFMPNIIIGSFIADSLELTTLKNCPKIVTKNFNVTDNNLSNLKYLPKKIGKSINLSYNKLTSLEGSPEIVNGSFNCMYNKLKDLKGAPKKILKDFNYALNNVTSLEGAPMEIGRSTSFFMLSVIKEDVIIQAEMIEKGYTNYWPDLYQYCLKNDIDLCKIKTWPKEFIDSLNDEDRKLLTSNEGITKFDL